MNIHTENHPELTVDVKVMTYFGVAIIGSIYNEGLKTIYVVEYPNGKKLKFTAEQIKVIE